jgi:hypothetical protein
MRTSHGASPTARRRLATIAVALSGLVGLAVGAAGPAFAGPANAETAAAPASVPGVRAVKPAPVAPPVAPNVGLGNAIPAKPHSGSNVVRPMTAWTVSMSASSTWLWPTQSSTVTATVNQDVGPTPYFIRIHDDTAGTYIATCGSGTSCSVPVTQPTPSTHDYSAWVADSSAAYPPGNVQATTFPLFGVTITWHGVGLSLSASATTLPVGSASTLTATTSSDIGPSPFYTSIFDVTTGTLVTQCGTGTTCTATVSQSAATTHEYTAFVAHFATTYPPTQVLATTPFTFVTWSNVGLRVSLSASGDVFSTQTVTATASADVGPTPYFIEIFDEGGTRMASCGSGTVCSFTYTPPFYPGSNLVAFISSSAATFPPSGIVASSNELTVIRQPIP